MDVGVVSWRLTGASEMRSELVRTRRVSDLIRSDHFPPFPADLRLLWPPHSKYKLRTVRGGFGTTTASAERGRCAEIRFWRYGFVRQCGPPLLGIRRDKVARVEDLLAAPAIGHERAAPACAVIDASDIVREQRRLARHPVMTNKDRLVFSVTGQHRGRQGHVRKLRAIARRQQGSLLVSGSIMPPPFHPGGDAVKGSFS